VRFVMFYHSLVSDWNHGNAHFLRGVVRVLQQRGHEVAVYEPRGGWSLRNLLVTEGPDALERFRVACPDLSSTPYDLDTLDLHEALYGADVVIVHEWNEPDLVARIGRIRRTQNFRLLFHDTHHRAVTRPRQICEFDLREYDGVLAFGEVIRQLYLDNDWIERAWTWHEAADTSVFRPIPTVQKEGDLVWVGNWGDDERTAELDRFLITPCALLGLEACVHGVRYPPLALEQLQTARIEYRGWIANFDVPRVFARHSVTVHIPRRPYVAALPGIPTIRVFEALACGIPLICTPWHDAEGLFAPGEDYLIAQNTTEMVRHLKDVLHDEELAGALSAHGLQTIQERHTCAHRVDQLLQIVNDLSVQEEERIPAWL
jgi:spore maturation protein CgeB